MIGSGFGGLFGTKALKRSDVDVTMVAKTTHHLFQPLLYQVATGILSEGEIAPPTREVLAKQKNAKVLLGEVTDIDLQAQTVTSHVLGRETVTPYDSLIVAAGSSQSYFGQRRVRRVRPRHEEHRRRARAARPDLRCLRARRARCDARRERRRAAHLRGGRRRPDRCRDGRPDRRAVPAHPQPRLPRHQLAQRPGHPRRRGRPGAAAVRGQARGQDQARAREARRRGAARRDGHRRRRGRPRGQAQGRHRRADRVRHQDLGGRASRPTR